jgi:hypothetical protein
MIQILLWAVSSFSKQSQCIFLLWYDTKFRVHTKQRVTYSAVTPLSARPAVLTVGL